MYLFLQKDAMVIHVQNILL